MRSNPFAFISGRDFRGCVLWSRGSQSGPGSVAPLCYAPTGGLAGHPPRPAFRLQSSEGPEWTDEGEPPEPGSGTA